MREISWGSEDGYELPKGGHPWLFLPDYVRAGGSICDADWRSAEAFIHNTRLDSSTKRVADGADAWLLSLGFTREGEYYRVTGGEYR